MIKTDEYGFIVQADGDGGDTCQRMGMYWVGMALDLYPTFFRVAPIATFYNACIASVGAVVRHPYQSSTDYVNNPKRLTRDQLDPLLIALGFTKENTALRELALVQLKNFGKYPSGDIPGLTTVAIYIRAMRISILYPLLFLLDIQLLLNAFAVYYRGRDSGYSDDNNHIIRLAQAQHQMPTIISYLARKLYMAIRPWNYGCQDGSNKNAFHPVIGALRYYHRAENNGNPDLGSMWIRIVKETF